VNGEYYSITIHRGDKNMTYRETIAKYEAGLITKTEANKNIGFLNMGSDSYYQPITGPEYK
jgi:hypothetical protein